MFYSQFILAKKGPLGTIWIAAHLERKLRKNQVADTDIGDSVDSILFPDVPIALRLSSHLLLGVVRIYSRKVGYLFDDCSEALLNIKQAFRSTTVDLPPEESSAPYHAITLPETFDLDDFALPDNDIFQGNYVDHHVSSKEQITLQDNMGATVYSTSQFGLDERFGDGETSQVGLDLEEDLLLDKVAVSRYGDISESVPQTPMEPMDCIETVADHDEVAEATQAMANEYAQAPSTPLLIGEPIEDGLARDDNLELENQNLTELRGIEGAHSASSKENGQHSATNQEKLACFESAATEESVPANGTADRLDGIEKMKEKVNGGSEQNTATTIAMNEEYENPVEARVHQTDADVAAPCNSQAGEPGVSPCKIDNTVVRSDLPAEDVSCLSTFSTEEGLHAIGASSEVQGENYRVKDHTQSDENNKLTASDNEKLKADDGKLDEHLDKATSTANQIENFNTHEELAEPEKLRSLPEGHFDKAEELLVESRPVEEVAEQVDGSQASNRVSGSKRTLPESSVTTSLNSVESFGTTNSKKTVDLVPDDDDLLSSILVGRRSSVLKVKPTPPAHDVVSRKRARPASRTSAMKRKVPMDDSMVLHGDTIRQQLIDTEDIRRVRKKAPCTRIEVLIIQRQFLEEEVFSEPVLTGVSAELRCLHNSLLDFSGVTISENADNNALMEKLQDKECVSTPITSQNTTEVICGNNVGQFEHASVQTKDNQDDNPNLASSDTGKLECINSNGREAGHETMDCERLAGITEMEIDGKTELAEAANPTIALAADSSQAENLCDDIAYVPTYPFTPSVLSNQHTGSEASVLMDALVTQSDYSSVQPKEAVASDMSNVDKGIEVGVSSDLETNAYAERNGDVDRTSLDADQAQEYNVDEKLGVCNDNEGPAQQSVHDDKELHLFDEEMRLDALLVGFNDGTEYASLADGQYPVYQDENQQSNTDSILTSFDHFFEQGNEDHAFANDTEFLNFDDESAGEEDDNGLPSGENTQLLVNSGWSARTRAVGKYLQTLFDDEVGHGRKFVQLGNLLAGKTRKEASRMFFETLVLKTKDYIQVEQAQPFDNISIMPVPKLMKSEF